MRMDMPMDMPMNIFMDVSASIFMITHPPQKI